MSVLVKEVIEKLRLDIVYGEPELLEKEINTADITRPGLEMTGLFLTTIRQSGFNFWG